MPRPGPRPYECVRRAWHSDSHHPMRGSIVSQIFRLVTEAHSAATRRNREWREKLPVVVIRAEEIMYSKANSEAEYLDPETLWDRLNDAIDTIIRKEEVVETGEYLQPCIEAALVLGCVPVKGSRSERLSNPRSYLPHRVQQPAPIPDKPVINRQPIHPKPTSPTNQSHFTKPAISSSNDPRLTLSVEPNNRCVNTGSVFPLYSGSQPGIHTWQNQRPGNVIVGTPIGWSSPQPSRTCMRELFPSHQDTQVDASTAGCDLSLTLGRNFDPRSASSYENPRIGFVPGRSSDDRNIDGDERKKRKNPFSLDTGEGSSQEPQRRPGQFPGQFAWRGL